MNSPLLKRNCLNHYDEIAMVAVSYLNANCKTCKHLKKFPHPIKNTHPIQEIHYNKTIIGECKKLSLLVYNNDKLHCAGLLYEEK